MANAYRELTARQQEEVNALPIKWAISNKQFDQMMAEWGLKLGEAKEKLYRIGGSGFIRKADADLIYGTFDHHRAELKEAIAADETGEGFILDMFRYELENHEYCITCDYTDTVDALGLTEEDFKQHPQLSKALRRACEEIIGEWEESE